MQFLFSLSHHPRSFWRVNTKKNRIRAKMTSLPGYENSVVCPYNKSHVILSHRIQTHLVKCARSNPGIKLEVCPFNSCHRMRSELFKVSFLASKMICFENNFNALSFNWLWNRHMSKNARIVRISIATCTLWETQLKSRLSRSPKQHRQNSLQNHKKSMPRTIMKKLGTM